MFQRLFFIPLAFILAVTPAQADEVPAELSASIIGKLSSALPDLEFSGVETSPVEGLYIVRIDGGTESIYVSKSGEYFLVGNLYQARSGHFVDVADMKANQIRRELMSSVKADDAIVFPASGEKKAVIYVFTDVDCGYCRKLHNEVVPDLTAKGVEVRYLAFPRAGVHSNSYRKIASAWCAEDKPAALTMLKQNRPVAENICQGNPVASQLALGRKVGVTGTPALVLEDGTMLPGYRPAAALLKILDI